MATVSPDKIIEDADMCVHGLNLQYSNEDVKQSIKDLCDSAASDTEKVHRVIFGNRVLDQAAKEADNEGRIHLPLLISL